MAVLRQRLRKASLSVKAEPRRVAAVARQRKCACGLTLPSPSSSCGDRARSREIREITGDYGRSRQITGDHGRSREITHQMQRRVGLSEGVDPLDHLPKMAGVFIKGGLIKEGSRVGDRDLVR